MPLRGVISSPIIHREYYRILIIKTCLKINYVQYLTVALKKMNRTRVMLFGIFVGNVRLFLCCKKQI